MVQGALMPRILAPLKAPPASFGWFASIKPFGPAARLRFGFASTVAIKVGAFSTIKRSSWQPGFFASLFFGPKTPLFLRPSLTLTHNLLTARGDGSARSLRGEKELNESRWEKREPPWCKDG